MNRALQWFDDSDAAPSASDRQGVLVVEDEADLRELLVFNLRDAGMAVEAVGTSALGMAAVARLVPSVVVLDLMLPDGSGVDLCRRVRADPEVSDVGVLMLTSRSEEYDRVLGFQVGADDYVTKPFSVREVVLRVRALGRRVTEQRAARAAPHPGPILTWRELSIDLARQIAFDADQELPLRPLECKLLSVLIEHPGRVFSRSDLLSEVWGISGERAPRTVDAHVCRVREHLGRHADAIETIHGFGYRLREP